MLLRKKKGFTLLEILIVVIILGILAGLAIPQYRKSIKKAKANEAWQVLGVMRGAQVRYYLEYGETTTHYGTEDKLDVDEVSSSYWTYTATDGVLGGVHAAGIGSLSDVILTLDVDGTKHESGW